MRAITIGFDDIKVRTQDRGSFNGLDSRREWSIEEIETINVDSVPRGRNNVIDDQDRRPRVAQQRIDSVRVIDRRGVSGVRWLTGRGHIAPSPVNVAGRKAYVFPFGLKEVMVSGSGVAVTRTIGLIVEYLKLLGPRYFLSVMIRGFDSIVGRHRERFVAMLRALRGN